MTRLIGQGVNLGGPSAWKSLRVKDLVLAYHWISGEPCLCLFPARARTEENRGSYVVPLSNCWAYIEGDRERFAAWKPSEYCFGAAIMATKVMGLDDTQSTVFAIVDALVEGIHHLVHMPPDMNSGVHAPEDLGEARLYVNGEMVAETGLLH